MTKAKLSILGAGLLALCVAGGAHAAPPDYYPADYGKMIEASKAEPGLLVYSNTSLANWKPVIDAFNVEYPWIKVEATDMRANEVFERYYAEQGTGVATGDILVAAAPLNWLDIIPKDLLLSYASPEKDHVPVWSVPAEGVYTMSSDPFVIGFNKLLLPEAQWPKSMQDLADLVAKDPDAYKNRIGTQHPSTSTYSQGLYWSVVNRNKDKAYEWFKTLGPVTTTYRSTSQALEKVASGEYLIAYFASTAQIINYVSDPAAATVVGWVFPTDAAAVYMRNVAITKTTKSPNSAKLLLDFILSKKGQTAVGQGGLLPYRADVDDPSAFRLDGLSYADMIAKVGEKNIILIDFNPDIVKGIVDVGARLDTLFAKQ